MLAPSHPNVVGPSKRPYHTILPAMVTDDAHGGRLAASFGVMGGFMQPQGHVQVLTSWLKYGLDPQAALDMPRLCLEPSDTRQPTCMQQPAARKRAGVEVFLEEGVGDDVPGKLKKWGHKVVHPLCGKARLPIFGRGQMIVITRPDEDE